MHACNFIETCFVRESEISRRLTKGLWIELLVRPCSDITLQRWKYFQLSQPLRTTSSTPSLAFKWQLKQRHQFNQEFLSRRCLRNMTSITWAMDSSGSSLMTRRIGSSSFLLSVMEAIAAVTDPRTTLERVSATLRFKANALSALSPTNRLHPERSSDAIITFLTWDSTQKSCTLNHTILLVEIQTSNNQLIPK